jgi:hypothetical protein
MTVIGVVNIEISCAAVKGTARYNPRLAPGDGLPPVVGSVGIEAEAETKLPSIETSPRLAPFVVGCPITRLSKFVGEAETT